MEKHLVLAFYAVSNGGNFERHSFDSVTDFDACKALLSLDTSECNMYCMDADLQMLNDRREFETDYNDESLDGGYWCKAMHLTSDEIKEAFATRLRNNMMLELANEHDLDMVYVSLPHEVCTSVKGFITYEDAKKFAEKIDGEVILITKGEGDKHWSHNGSALMGIDMEQFVDTSNYEIFTDQYSFEDWCSDEIQHILSDGFYLFDLQDTIRTMCDTYDEISNIASDEMVLVDNSDYTCETIEKEVMEYYNDGMCYAIAVTYKR